MSDRSSDTARLSIRHRLPPQSVTLGIDSTLAALPLHQAELPLEALGSEAAVWFNRSPRLPGLLLTSPDAIVGMLSRQRFLEFLLRPQGCELFLHEPLSVIDSYTRLRPLVLPQTTPVLVAARIALRRPSELQGEPIVVTTAEGDRLLSAHDLNQAHWQIRGIETQVRYERTQAAMLQSHKMAELGRLVDGIAHEMMDPLGFVWGNLSHVDRYCQQLLELISAYRKVCANSAAATDLAELAELEAAMELEYLREDLPQTLSSIKSGAGRLKQLASSLQNFCHIDEVYPRPADLHGLIDSIVLLLKSRLATQIQIQRHYEALPPVLCFAGQLSQVLMNVLTHCVDDLLSLAARQSVVADLTAADTATADQSPAPPQIVITTQLRDAATDQPPGDRWVVLTIADNGPGLSPTALQQLRDTFSIRQRLERETDLATSYRLVTAKHGGKFEVRSPATLTGSDANASGTEFEIQLPLHQSAESER